jgi:hypothetical protein
MSDLAITTRKPQDTDTERLLLARLLAASAVKTTGTALASAARTATTQSSDIDTNGYSRIAIFLNVTAASGTGGLNIRIRAKDPVSLGYAPLIISFTAITSVQTVPLLAGPGLGAILAGSNNGCVAGVALPETIRLEVTHADASSYTYSLGYCLIP